MCMSHGWNTSDSPPPHTFMMSELRDLHPTIPETFRKPTIRHPEPFHDAISQFCGDEKWGRVWPFLSSSLFMCTSQSSHLVPLYDGLLFTPSSSVGCTFALRCGWTTLCRKLRVEHSDASTCPCEKKGSSAKNSIHHHQIFFVTLHYQHQHRSQNSASDGLCVTL